MPNPKHPQSLTSSELDEAAYIWIYCTQQLCFLNEIFALSQTTQQNIASLDSSAETLSKW